MSSSHRHGGQTSVWVCALLGILVGFGATGVRAQVTFTDVTTQFGMEGDYGGIAVGGGASWIDYEGDGDLDLIVSCGRNCAFELFRNNGGGTGFTREPLPVAVSGTEETKAVVFVDVDDDSDLDMMCSSHMGQVRLCENTPTGIVVVDDWGWNLQTPQVLYGIALADYDGDGDLDLYVANHGQKNMLFRNDGDTFTDVAGDLGLTDPGLGFQPVWFDYDNDGDQDLYCSNDKAANTGYPNVLYRNEGDGTFTDVSAASGADLVGELMGVAVGDYNNDGYMDFYTTNTPLPQGGLPGNLLGRNNGDGTFTEVARDVGVAMDEICWGANFFDADNDGDLDLYVAAMDTDDTDRLYLNNGDGTFTDGTIGSGIEDLDRTFGSAIGDYDDDGDIDLYVVNSSGTNRLFRNDGPHGNWVKLNLRGTESNRHAVGSRVIARVGALEQHREVSAGISYLSQDAFEVHFGFGTAVLIDEIEIRWPSGQVTLLEDVSVNQTLDVVEPYNASTVQAMEGTVAASVGSPVEVLFINGSSGDAFREVFVGRNESVTLQIDAAPLMPQSEFVLYGFGGVPRSGNVTTLPLDLGLSTFSTPVNGGAVDLILNSLGHERVLGESDFNVPPAPFQATRQMGFDTGRTIALQALLRDNQSLSETKISVSNLVILQIP